MFDVPTETSEDLRHYRKLIKKLEEEGFYRFQFSVYVRVCADIADVKAAKIRLKNKLGHFPGNIMALSLTDKQFVSMEEINFQGSSSNAPSLAASTKRMVVL